ncbi:MAG: UDP-glucose--hexose-1-phosphate uridylyltransferase [Candidatus Acidiferrales bacterium]
MSGSVLNKIPHRRFNPLTREWVIVSPHRTERPWIGNVEKLPPQYQPAYDPDCCLCPGNSRAGGQRNPQYTGTFGFDNDYPALLPDAAQVTLGESGLIVAHSERGLCRVVCSSPRHDLTIPRMQSTELREVVEAWTEQFRSLGAMPWVRHVQIFENRGALMGASNPHPHCQIWATATVPDQPTKEYTSFREYREGRHSCLLCDYLQLELKLGERFVCENDAFVVLMPYWAEWPFETLVLSKRHLGTMGDLSSEERDLLGDILRRITVRYDNLFEVPFPYSMGFHQAPSDGAAHPEWHFHAHFYPPLLRSATVRKFMVGFEMLGTPQRDFTPESACVRIRDAGETHYLDQGLARHSLGRDERR